MSFRKMYWFAAMIRLMVIIRGRDSCPGLWTAVISYCHLSNFQFTFSPSFCSWSPSGLKHICFWKPMFLVAVLKARVPNSCPDDERHTHASKPHCWSGIATIMFHNKPIKKKKFACFNIEYCSCCFLQWLLQ